MHMQASYVLALRCTQRRDDCILTCRASYQVLKYREKVLLNSMGSITLCKCPQYTLHVSSHVCRGAWCAMLVVIRCEDTKHCTFTSWIAVHLEHAAAAKAVKVVKQRTGSTFSGFSAKVKLLWPFLWPKGHFVLQVRIVLCIITLVGIRIVNVLVPLYYKRIIDKLSTQVSPDYVTTNGYLRNASAEEEVTGDVDGTLGATHTEFPLTTIVVYVVLRFLQGGGIGSMGLLSNLRTFLWIDVQQYTSRSIRVRLFKHFHDQDLKCVAFLCSS